MNPPGLAPQRGSVGSLLLCVAALSLAIGVLTVLTLEQVGTFLHHDNLHSSYPLRVLVSRSFVAGIPPLWNFWSHAGTPLATLFDSIAESPVVRLVSCLGIYSESSFTLEVMLVFVLGFSGFYLWCRDFTRPSVALIGAYAYTLAPCNVVQMPINIENVVSAFMYPWILLGLRRAFTGRASGIVFLTVGIWVSATTGYLGVNVIAFQFLLLYAVGEWCFHAESGKELRLRIAAVTQNLPHLGLAALLTLALLSFPLLETGALFHYDFAQIRSDNFNPFTGTTSLVSLVTLVFPNSVSTFATDSDDGHVVLLFGGLTVLFFAVFALTQRAHRGWKLWLLFIAALSFASTLSPSSRISVILVDHIPFYKSVRFHCWMVNVSLLLLVELGCVGIEEFLRRETSRIRAGRGAFLALAFLALLSHVLIQQSRHPAFVSVPPLAMRWQIYPVCLLAAALLLRRNGGLESRHLALAIFVAVASEPIMLRHQYLHLTHQQERVMNAAEPRSFVPTGNVRVMAIRENDQYFTQAMAVRNYHPLIMPSIKAILERREEDHYLKRVFYPASAMTKPSPGGGQVEITFIDPVRMKATITTSAPDVFVWSVPFTSNWRLWLNGEPHTPIPSPEGLTLLSLESGTTSVELAYQPSYLRLCRWLRLLAILTLAIVALRESLRLGSDPGGFFGRAS